MLKNTFDIIGLKTKSVCVLVAQSCPTLWDPMNYSPPGSSVHGTLQARILEWDAISFSRRFSRPRNQTEVSSIAGRRFTVWATKEAPKTKRITHKQYNLAAAVAKLHQSCPTLCDPINGSPPGSPVHGILQARILKWVAISFSRESSDPGIEPASPTLAGGFFYHWATREALTFSICLRKKNCTDYLPWILNINLT